MITNVSIVHCDDCGSWGAEEETPGCARSMAKREGWHLVMPDAPALPGQMAKKIDICPKCWKRRYLHEEKTDA